MAGEILRKAVRNLDAQELARLRDGYRQFQSIRDNRSYDFIAGMHGVPGFWCWHQQRQRFNPAELRLFLPWHRAYLYAFEQSLRDVSGDDTLAVPWWDWSSEASRQEGLPAAFSDPTTPEGQPNPLFSYHVFEPKATPPIDKDTIRFPGTPSDLPFPNVPDAVPRLLSEFPSFNDFSDVLQQVHDFIHGWTGGRRVVDGQEEFGDMGSVATAAFDPVFWSHHCMVDRVWALWQVRHGISNIPEELLDLVLAPFPFTVRMVLDINDLGYEYAGQTLVV